ncbi:hypothetical protein D3C73_1293870 [compost metagenome]
MGIVIGDDRAERSLEGRVQPLQPGYDRARNEMGADDDIRAKLLNNIIHMGIKKPMQGKCGKTIERFLMLVYIPHQLGTG